MIKGTKIQYMLVVDKLYKVTDIDFPNLTLSASECDMKILDVPDGELFKVDDFKEFHIKLRNWHGNITDFKTYVENRKMKS